ncbi:hypothetical protein KOR42_44660 [Thalassoglobus neptunius]|uniref:DUF4381 domain-containing protein n=1 Tax=Thalassoglobus neptunius TaxID=1938619 RepID=A0A5C5W033_9PLAN|nr:DUF4381 domain-containing protein [Thalassoglobus neptunius]TWT43525.1 hypothetical protein KOR42_44660 [Thalassoglobus neptunius]
MMKTDPASLSNLQDIVLQEPVSWWPLAPGWWVVLGICAIGLAVWTFRIVRRWKANAYRREAIALIEDARTVADVANVMKRTSLSAYPRQDVAKLSGTKWCDWLNQTGQLEMKSAVRRTLTEALYSGDATDGLAELKSFATDWTKRHTSNEEDV